LTASWQRHRARRAARAAPLMARALPPHQRQTTAASASSGWLCCDKISFTCRIRHQARCRCTALPNMHRVSRGRITSGAAAAVSGRFSRGCCVCMCEKQRSPHTCILLPHRRAQPGMPMQTSAAAAAPDVDTDSAAAGATVAADGTASSAENENGGGGAQLTKRQRGRLAKRQRRRQEKARKREQQQQPQLPSPPTGTIDKVQLLRRPCVLSVWS